MAFKIARTLSVNNSTGETINRRAKFFWESKRMRFEEKDGSLSGKRGNLLWNTVTPDPTLLLARIQITSLEPSKLDCILTVSTLFQIWTKWDTTAFELEMDIFANFLLDGNLRNGLWQDYCRAYARQYWMATLTFGLLGLKMSEAEKTTFLSPVALNGQDLNCVRIESFPNHEIDHNL